MEIRPALSLDAGAIAAIYRYHVLHGTGTFEEDPPSVTTMAARLADVQARGWPWLVAEQAGTVLGYAYATQFRDRAAYRFSAENSIYVDPSYIGSGVGRGLLDALMSASAEAGFQRMFAVIGDSANLASICLHARAGFTPAGQLDAAGFKFGRTLDVVFMQRMIGKEESQR